MIRYILTLKRESRERINSSEVWRGVIKMNQTVQGKGMMNAQYMLALFSNSPALLSGECVRKPPSLLEAKSRSSAIPGDDKNSTTQAQKRE